MSLMDHNEGTGRKAGPFFLNYIRTPQRAPLLLMAFGELVLITLNLEL
jgi:hypothetical protein